jgi:hypothetical protein
MSTFGTDGTVLQQGVPDSMFGIFKFQEFTVASQSVVPSSFNHQTCTVDANLGHPYGGEFCVVHYSGQVSQACLPHPACCLLCKQAQETIQHLLIFP